MSLEMLAILLFVCFCLWNLGNNVKQATQSETGKSLIAFGLKKWFG